MLFMWVFVEAEPDHDVYVKHFFSSDIYEKHCYCDTIRFWWQNYIFPFLVHNCFHII